MEYARIRRPSGFKIIPLKTTSNYVAPPTHPHQTVHSINPPEPAGGGYSIMGNSSTANGVLIGLLSSFGSAILIASVFLIVYFFKYTQGGRILLDRIGRPGEFDDEQEFLKQEEEWLADADENQKADYLRAKGMDQS